MCVRVCSCTPEPKAGPTACTHRAPELVFPPRPNAGFGEAGECRWCHRREAVYAHGTAGISVKPRTEERISTCMQRVQLCLRACVYANVCCPCICHSRVVQLLGLMRRDALARRAHVLDVGAPAWVGGERRTSAQADELTRITNVTRRPLQVKVAYRGKTWVASATSAPP